MLLECRYVQAIKYRDSGDYELANIIFESLGDYRDSKILIHKHDYKVSDTVAATCTVEGSETYKCTTCDDGYMKTVGKVNHSYSLFSSKDATCTTAGSNSFKCSGCEHIYSVISEQLTHNYKAISTQVPTCQKEGYTTYKCSLCNDEYTETQGKTSHDTFLASTNDSTCTALGSENYECKNCTYTYAEEIAKKSHNYTDATCTAPKTCDMCGKTEGQELGHSNDLICTRCGESTFEKLVISGVGDKYYTDFDIPSGTYNITFNISSHNSVYMYINDRSIASAYGGETITQKYISERNNAILHISASSSVQWTITIEAVGN
jgi:rubredoxin